MKVIKHVKQLFKFGGVGIVNTVVDFIVFGFFSSILKIPAWSAQAFGYAAGMTNSFILNRGFTFHSSESPRFQLVRFVCANLISLSMSVLVMKAMVDRFALNPYFAKTFILIITQSFNYTLYSFWVFRK